MEHARAAMESETRRLNGFEVLDWRTVPLGRANRAQVELRNATAERGAERDCMVGEPCCRLMPDRLSADRSKFERDPLPGA